MCSPRSRRQDRRRLLRNVEVCQVRAPTRIVLESIYDAPAEAGGVPLVDRGGVWARLEARLEAPGERAPPRQAQGPEHPPPRRCRLRPRQGAEERRGRVQQEASLHRAAGQGRAPPPAHGQRGAVEERALCPSTRGWGHQGRDGRRWQAPRPDPRRPEPGHPGRERTRPCSSRARRLLTRKGSGASDRSARDARR